MLHEGFYKLAAAVQRPAPSLRQKALALQRHLEEQLQGPPAPQAALGAVVGAVEHTDTFLTQEERLDRSRLTYIDLEAIEHLVFDESYGVFLQTLVQNSFWGERRERNRMTQADFHGQEPSLDATKLQLQALPPAEEPKVADSARRELELCVRPAF